MDLLAVKLTCKECKTVPIGLEEKRQSLPRSIKLQEKPSLRSWLTIEASLSKNDSFAKASQRSRSSYKSHKEHSLKELLKEPTLRVCLTHYWGRIFLRFRSKTPARAQGSLRISRKKMKLSK